MQDTLAPVMKQSLADRLAQQLRQLIQSAGYQVGDRLPTIMDMAHQFRELPFVGHVETAK